MLIKINNKIKKKIILRYYFKFWWFHMIILFSIKLIQKTFRGFYFRKKKLCIEIKKILKNFVKNYQICQLFRRKIRMRNILCGLRKNILLCQIERDKKVEEHLKKKYFRVFYQYTQFRLKNSYCDYKRNINRKKYKFKKSIFSFQYSAAMRILQKNIHFESVLYFRNISLFYGFFRLLTKKQKIWRKEMKINNFDQKNRIFAAVEKFKKRNINTCDYNFDNNRSNIDNNNNKG